MSWRRPRCVFMERVKQQRNTNPLAFPQTKIQTFARQLQRGLSPPSRTQTGRWLCIHLPQFSLEVLTKDVELATAFAVVEGKSKSRVLICNQCAENKGLQVGMSLSAAFALVPDLGVKERDGFAENSALEALAGWATQFTSLVSLAPPQALLLEVGGSERLFGGMASLINAISQGLQQLGYIARIATAPTPLAALLLSRANSKANSGANSWASSWVSSQTHSMTRDLAGVSLDDSGLEAKVVRTLHTLGLRTFADCFRLPRDGLARRVGPQVVAFLDKVLGIRPDPRTPYLAPKRFERQLLLGDEIETSAALLFVLRKALLELTGVLRASDHGIQTLVITLFHQKHQPTQIEVALLSPSRDEHHLQLLVKEHLDQLSLPSPVERVGIKTGEFVTLAPNELDFFDTSNHSSEDWPRLIEKLGARLGREAVYCLDTACEHRPERAWNRNFPSPQPLARGRGSFPGNQDRPVWLLPQPLRLRTHNHCPQLRGPLQLPRPCERIESGWWDGNDVSRDYFIALNEAGECCWIFRDRRSPSSWYLHGIFA